MYSVWSSELLIDIARAYIINPLHMRKRVTVVCLSVCVCYRSNCSNVDFCYDFIGIGMVSRRLLTRGFAEIALFKCHGIIYLRIDAAMYDVL